jgi:hypothetical protein
MIGGNLQSNLSKHFLFFVHHSNNLGGCGKEDLFCVAICYCSCLRMNVIFTVITCVRYVHGEVSVISMLFV